MQEDFSYLKLDSTRRLNVNYQYLEPYKDDIMRFLDNDDMRTLSFAKRAMMSQEIKANNTIEGINDDLSIIDEVIKNKSSLSDREKKRIINLYHGYQYILTHKDINKETLRELYLLLSDEILDDYDKTSMGEYYRTKPVYILKGSSLNNDYYEGINPKQIDCYMNYFIDYINSDFLTGNEIDSFVKSQIMHFYFVHIHPYPDVNGRTSRTVAMWYLLNQKSYPYVIFNRAISFSKSMYEKNLIITRDTDNITLFLKYMLKNTLLELEKEYIIGNIKRNSDANLTKVDLQMIEYLLTTNSNLTAKDLATTYNSYNDHRRINMIIDERIMPLVEKNIFVRKNDTKGFIDGVRHNFNIGINKDLLDIKKEKIKYLKIDRYV